MRVSEPLIGWGCCRNKNNIRIPYPYMHKVWVVIYLYLPHKVRHLHSSQILYSNSVYSNNIWEKFWNGINLTSVITHLSQFYTFQGHRKRDIEFSPKAILSHLESFVSRSAPIWRWELTRTPLRALIALKLSLLTSKIQ